MIRQFEKFLTDAQLQELNAVLDKAAFVDGASTAGVAARRVKNNLQAKAAQPGTRSGTGNFRQGGDAKHGIPRFCPAVARAAAVVQPI